MTQRAHLLRLGTRGSLLARSQSQTVADAVEACHPAVRVELHIIRTSGDRITDRPLHDLGGKGLFTKELEQALLAGEVDFAVHSFKDVPITQPLVDTSGLTIAAVPVREDARDVLVSSRARRIEDLPAGARVGTGSFRRRCQLLHARPDLGVQPIRGNIDTRLRKLREGEYDAIVIALAGVRRAGLFDEQTMTPIYPATLLAAPGQGALALQCRHEDERTRALLAALDDPVTARCVAAERRLVDFLHGDCHSPIAAAATIESMADFPPRLRLIAAVGARDGNPPVIRADAVADADDPHGAAEAVGRLLEQQGVHEMLATVP